MFFSNNKNELVNKNKALVGRENPINNSLFNEINGLSLNEIPKGYKYIILGMGCFWGAEKIFWNLKGVYVTSVGYAGGYTLNPTYDEVCSGLTGHTEVVKVIYDPTTISLEKIMIYFWEGHNPTQGMRQGNDFGTQYRSAIYTSSSGDLEVVKETKKEFQDILKKHDLDKITTEIKSNIIYYFAENYHQQYLYKNPNGYCGLGGCGVKF
ncbi:peptide-methionine (S)-S-oxide reductase MsrA [Alphaproteobacteria bacterium]|jgi:peptide-methionine (S)-S-oxide reductase|nr:peptide-methionine (S)-S-oxide reductase MsrA [Alphaproteobacteria bacterium]MDB9872222.1 peptide-methionine (S)-S-oxide reductase MsrA [Alphaproteobacteria bacterium]|tara:strand:- start:8753 stop:9379 length:627 start_codon:yes stop_codon:yes gene_type:complete